MSRLERWGGGAQLLRGLLALAFPYLLAQVPAEISYTAPLIGAGVFAYVAARWLVLAEPTTLRDLGPVSPAHLGEAVFLSVALAIALVVLAESDVLNLGLGAGTAIVLGYLFLHALLLPLLASLLIKRSTDKPERPNLRRFIRAAAFVAGETVAVMLIGMALDKHDVARSGPWGLWDVVPIYEIVLLVVGYAPIIWLEMAATKQRSTTGAEFNGAFNALLIQGAAIVVCALTGRVPLL